MKKKLFDSQETPEEAAAFAATGQSLVSPRTLVGATFEAMRAGGTPACLKKKVRKRPNTKKAASASKPVPGVLLDRLPT